jgi:hypothetical protein
MVRIGGYATVMTVLACLAIATGPAGAGELTDNHFRLGLVNTIVSPYGVVVHANILGDLARAARGRGVKAAGIGVVTFHRTSSPSVVVLEQAQKRVLTVTSRAVEAPVAAVSFGTEGWFFVTDSQTEDLTRVAVLPFEIKPRTRRARPAGGASTRSLIAKLVVRGRDYVAFGPPASSGETLPGRGCGELSLQITQGAGIVARRAGRSKALMDWLTSALHRYTELCGPWGGLGGPPGPAPGGQSPLPPVGNPPMPG